MNFKLGKGSRDQPFLSPPWLKDNITTS